MLPCALKRPLPVNFIIRAFFSYPKKGAGFDNRCWKQSLKLLNQGLVLIPWLNYIFGPWFLAIKTSPNLSTFLPPLFNKNSSTASRFPIKSHKFCAFPHFSIDGYSGKISGQWSATTIKITKQKPHVLHSPMIFKFMQNYSSSSSFFYE